LGVDSCPFGVADFFGVDSCCFFGVAAFLFFGVNCCCFGVAGDGGVVDWDSLVLFSLSKERNKSSFNISKLMATAAASADKEYSDAIRGFFLRREGCSGVWGSEARIKSRIRFESRCICFVGVSEGDRFSFGDAATGEEGVFFDDRPLFFVEGGARGNAGDWEDGDELALRLALRVERPGLSEIGNEGAADERVTRAGVAVG